MLFEAFLSRPSCLRRPAEMANAAVVLLALLSLFSPILAEMSPSASLYLVANQLTLNLPRDLHGLAIQWPALPPSGAPLSPLDIFSALSLASPGGHINVHLTNATVESLMYNNNTDGNQTVKMVIRLGLDEIAQVIAQIHSFDNFDGMTVLLNDQLVVNITKYFCMYVCCMYGCMDGWMDVCMY
jgi:hypothetical protein